MKNSKNYFNNPKNLDIPWVESPFFSKILKERFYNHKFKKLAQKFNKDGYCIVDLNLSKSYIENLLSDLQKHLSSGNIKKNPKIYHYNASPRIVEAWKFSPNIKKLALNKIAMSLLFFLYQKKPIPFSTINFIKGTDQPLHSDYIHFGSMPEKYLAASWVALEDVNKKNGPIQVALGSHKLPIIDYNSLNLETPDSISSLEKNYRVYEQYVKDVVSSNQFQIKEICLKKGQAIIWAANLLHGGKKIISNDKTRLSQVTHYHFHDCDFYYNPQYSNSRIGKFLTRDLSQIEIK